MRLSKNHFWNWFARNQQEYADMKNKSKKEFHYLMSEMKTHLRTYYRALDCTLAWIPNKPAILTITVGGKVELFEKVDAFVAKAPEIPGWKIVALECPHPIDFYLEPLIKKTSIHPDELRFSITGGGERGLNITVYHPLCRNDNENMIGCLAETAIFNLLGERSFGINIGYVDVANSSIAISTDLQGLEELPRIISESKKGMRVDGRGNLLN